MIEGVLSDCAKDEELQVSGEKATSRKLTVGMAKWKACCDSRKPLRENNNNKSLSLSGNSLAVLFKLIIADS